MRHILHTFKHRPRYTLAMLVTALLGGAFAITGARASQAVLWALDAGLLFFLTSTSMAMSRGTPASMLQRAQCQTIGKPLIIGLTAAISAVVLIALYTETHIDQNHHLAGVQLALAALSIVLAWLFLVFVFGIEYAHAFALNRLDTGADGGLQFPNTPEPDYWDFMYFSAILSMAFQTADVQITSRHMRRMVLLHSILAFFFNMVILSMSINTIAATL